MRNILAGLLLCSILSGCGSGHPLRSPGTRYYAGEVHNADLVLQISKDPHKADAYWLYAAPVRIGKPVPGWKITHEQALAALRNVQGLRPLILRNYGGGVYTLTLRYEPSSELYCTTTFHREGVELHLEGADFCDGSARTSPDRVPMSGTSWTFALKSRHRFYPLP